MDKANAALVHFLISSGVPVHLVTLSAAPEVSSKAGVTCSFARFARACPPLGRRHLARLGYAAAKRLNSQSPAARVVVNGINCSWADINWVHWVHQRWQAPPSEAPLWFRLKHRVETSRATALERRWLRSARLVVANSERTRCDLINLLGLAPQRVYTIYPGTDSAWQETPERRHLARRWLGIESGRPLIAFVGALGHDSRKGFDILWRAWTDLCRNAQWDTDLVVAGSGRALSHWRNKALTSGLSGRVRFLGFTARVLDVLAASDLLVSPARYESYGLNVQEALCSGIPAIVSANAGVAERYPAELSPLLLQNPENSGDLANRMLLWRQNMAVWVKLVEPTMRRLRTYTWNDMARRIFDLAEKHPVAVGPAGARRDNLYSSIDGTLV
jgi:glycosyltransferase involved in cell wall biosynthesis